MTLKQCTRCKETKQDTEFTTRGGNGKYAHSLKAECKSCCSAVAAAWAKANPERQYRNALRSAAMRYQKLMADSDYMTHRDSRANSSICNLGTKETQGESV